MAGGKEVTLVFEKTPEAGVPVQARVYDPGLSIWPDPGPLPGIEHPICLPGMPCWEGLPPIEELPSYHAGWNARADGWYFRMGPLDKPKPVGERCQLDPEKTRWDMGVNGWWLVSGPYDKPIPVFGEPPPDTEEPPQTEPLPPGSTSKWVWTGAQWGLATFTIFPADAAQPKK